MPAIDEPPTKAKRLDAQSQISATDAGGGLRGCFGGRLRFARCPRSAPPAARCCRRRCRTNGESGTTIGAGQ